MTWWDHKTGSVWSQVWGQAIAGPLKGTTLELIPASIVPWGVWRAEHPDTLAMTTSKKGLFNRTEWPHDDWVVGIALGEHSKAYPFRALAQERVVNDTVGPYPLLLYVEPDTRRVAVYLRQVADQRLTFRLAGEGQQLVDAETGTRWSIAQGVAQAGPLQGQTLRQVPYLSSFDWAWRNFHPDTDFYQ